MVPLCLMRNHRSQRRTISDGSGRESCRRLRSGTMLSLGISMAVASVKGRSFLQGGSVVGSAPRESGDAGRFREFLVKE